MCRQGMYAQSIPDLKASMVLFSNSIGNQLGTDYPVSVTAPVATALEGTMFIRLFLDQVRDTHSYPQPHLYLYLLQVWMLV